MKTENRKCPRRLAILKDARQHRSANTASVAVTAFVKDQFGGLNHAEEAGAYSFAAWLAREGYTLTKGGSPRAKKTAGKTARKCTCGAPIALDGFCTNGSCPHAQGIR